MHPKSNDFTPPLEGQLNNQDKHPKSNDLTQQLDTKRATPKITQIAIYIYIYIYIYIKLKKK